MKRKKKPSMAFLRNKVKKWEITKQGVEITLHKNFTFKKENTRQYAIFDSISQARRAVSTAVEVRA